MHLDDVEAGGRSAMDGPSRVADARDDILQAGHLGAHDAACLRERRDEVQQVGPVRFPSLESLGRLRLAGCLKKYDATIC